MKILQILRKSTPAIKNYDSEEEKHIKLELAKEKIQNEAKLCQNFKMRKVEIIKTTDAEKANYAKELTKNDPTQTENK